MSTLVSNLFIELHDHQFSASRLFTTDGAMTEVVKVYLHFFLKQIAHEA